MMFAGHNRKRPPPPEPSPHICNFCCRKRVGQEPWYFFADGTQSCEECEEKHFPGVEPPKVNNEMDAR